MRRCMIVTWILILSTANFALGVPVAVREGLEMSVDVDLVEDGKGKATSQKRTDPLDDSSTSNAVDRLPTPQSWNPSDLDGLREELDRSPTPQSWNPPSNLDGVGEGPKGQRTGSPTQESPKLVYSNWPNYAPSNPGSPTGSHPGQTGGSPLPPLHSEQLGDRLPSTPTWSVNSDTLSPQSPTGDSPLPPPPHPGPSEDRLPSTPGWLVNPDTLSPQSPTGGSPLPHPGLSEDRLQSRPAWSVNPDTLLSQSPTGGSRLSPLPSLLSPLPSLLSPLPSPWPPPPSPLSPMPSPLSPLPSHLSHLPHPGPSEDRLQSTQGWSVNPDTLSPQSPTSGSPLPSLPHPGPSEDRLQSRPVSSVNSNTLSPQSPTSGSPVPYTEPPSLVSSPDEFMDNLLKGKIRRRSSGSGAVNLAQKDPRLLKFPRRRRHPRDEDFRMLGALAQRTAENVD